MAQKWVVFTSLKAKKTAQTKPYKTTLHTNGSEKRPARLGSWIACTHDRSQTWVRLKLKTFSSPVEPAVLSKLCVALHGNVCSNRHSWHIRLATLSKSHIHRFICDGLLAFFFVFFCFSKIRFYIKRRPVPIPLQALAILVTNSEKKTKRKRKKKDILFCNRLTPSYTNIHTTHSNCTHARFHARIILWFFLHISKQVPLFISALTEPR